MSVFDGRWGEPLPGASGGACKAILYGNACAAPKSDIRQMSPTGPDVGDGANSPLLGGLTRLAPDIDRLTGRHWQIWGRSGYNQEYGRRWLGQYGR